MHHREFQFHIGAIKTLSDFGIAANNFSFNSTLVRLKHYGMLDSSYMNLFQFHIGAIKTWCADYWAVSYAVSIPHWCD